jgi:hypothetical protein
MTSSVGDSVKAKSSNNMTVRASGVLQHLAAVKMSFEMGRVELESVVHKHRVQRVAAAEGASIIATSWKRVTNAIT